MVRALGEGGLCVQRQAHGIHEKKIFVSSVGSAEDGRRRMPFPHLDKNGETLVLIWLQVLIRIAHDKPLLFGIVLRPCNPVILIYIYIL